MIQLELEWGCSRWHQQGWTSSNNLISPYFIIDHEQSSHLSFLWEEHVPWKKRCFLLDRSECLTFCCRRKIWSASGKIAESQLRRMGKGGWWANEEKINMCVPYTWWRLKGINSYYLNTPFNNIRDVKGQKIKFWLSSVKISAKRKYNFASYKQIFIKLTFRGA